MIYEYSPVACVCTMLHAVRQDLDGTSFSCELHFN